MTISPTKIEELRGLAPCPFCGGEALRMTIGEDEPNNAGGDVIACTRCQASSHVEFGCKENLVDRWNQRADPAALADENAGLRAALKEAAAIAECAFDDRPNSRAGHHSEMDWTDGYRDGTRAAAAAIRAARALPESDRS